MEKSTPTIIIRDALRKAVEKQTEGRVTVLYDEHEIPSFMLVIPKFRVEDIESGLGRGVHPAFLVNGEEKSEIFIGQFPGTEINGLAYSLPNADAWYNINFDKARAACVGKGKGWHLVTAWEYGALVCHLIKTRNKDYVRRQWQWEWNDGLLLRDGMFHFPNDNDFEADEETWPTQGVGFDDQKGDPVLSAEISHYSENLRAGVEYGNYTGVGFDELKVTPSFLDTKGEVQDRMAQLLIYPRATSLFSEINSDVWVRNYGECRLIRGSYWNNTSYAGLGALNLSNRRAGVGTHVGFRPAFVNT